MSWGFSEAGNPKAVAKRVEESRSDYCPRGIKDLVKFLAERVPDDRILIVESTGHNEIRTEPLPEGKTSWTEEEWKEQLAKGAIVYGNGSFSYKILPRAEEV